MISKTDFLFQSINCEKINSGQCLGEMAEVRPRSSYVRTCMTVLCFCRVFLVRAPRLFPILWTLVSSFIDENTRKKFIIYGGSDHEESEGLSACIERKFIPKFLGGDAVVITIFCRVRRVCGALVKSQPFLTLVVWVFGWRDSA